jgi:hypothetical protein
MSVYYAIVDGDPLTSGPNSRVYAWSKSCFIDDPDGRERSMAFIGDKVHCEKCNSTGTIMGGARVSNEHRLIDLENGGRRQAVGGDYVLCKCPERPQVIARYGRNWIIEDGGDVSQQTTRMSAANAVLSYDERFTLTDTEGNPLRSIRYRVRIGSNVVASGATDPSGQTQRIVTNGSQNLTLEIEH